MAEKQGGHNVKRGVSYWESPVPPSMSAATSCPVPAVADAAGSSPAPAWIGTRRAPMSRAIRRASAL
ncbi:hypothetical protein [Microtetraspora niveoalba]|uniref:hypothetical protein n=1 Tax=Microtetraspora niveoalba TaxID=46175 RepID=UPI00082E5E20|nr:hypothetical protein [Microtetraspora niveoalba]